MPARSRIQQIRRSMPHSVAVRNRNIGRANIRYLEGEEERRREELDIARELTLQRKAAALQQERAALREHRNPARHLEEAKQSQALTRAERLQSRNLRREQLAHQQKVDIDRNKDSFAVNNNINIPRKDEIPLSEMDIEQSESALEYFVKEAKDEEPIALADLADMSLAANNLSQLGAVMGKEFNILSAIPARVMKAPQTTKRKRLQNEYAEVRKKLREDQTEEWLNSQFLHDINQLRQNEDLQNQYRNWYFNKYKNQLDSEQLAQYEHIIKDKDNPFQKDSDQLKHLGISEKTTCVRCSRVNGKPTKTKNDNMEIKPIYSKVGKQGNTMKYQLKSTCRVCMSKKSTILNHYFTGGKLRGGAIQFITQ